MEYFYSIYGVYWFYFGRLAKIVNNKYMSNNLMKYKAFCKERKLHKWNNIFLYSKVGKRKKLEKGESKKEKVRTVIAYKRKQRKERDNLKEVMAKKSNFNYDTLI